MFWFPRSPSENTGTLSANALIGIGLIVEYIVILRAIVASGEATRLSDEKVAEANKVAQQAVKEAAEARERAAKVEQLTAWRHIDAEATDTISRAFSGKSSILSILVEYQSGDAEAFSLACELAQLFTELGNRKIVFQSNSHLDRTLFGVTVRAGICAESDEILIGPHRVVRVEC